MLKSTYNEFLNTAWVKAKETLSQEHPALQDTIEQLTVSDFTLIEAWQGILNNEHFQLDLYTLHGNFLLIVSQYGDSEIRINLSKTRCDTLSGIHRRPSRRNLS
jgi:hypothetical protein